MFLRKLVRLIFSLIHCILIFLFITPYFLTADDYGPGFDSVLFSKPLTWLILISFLATFPSKWTLMKKLKKTDPPWSRELKNQFLWLLIRTVIITLWIIILISVLKNTSLLTFIDNGKSGQALLSVSVVILTILFWFWVVTSGGRRAKNHALYRTILQELNKTYTTPEESQIKKLLKLEKNLHRTKGLKPLASVTSDEPERLYNLTCKEEVFERSDHFIMDVHNPEYYHSFRTVKWQLFFTVFKDTTGITSGDIDDVINLYEGEQKEEIIKALRLWRPEKVYIGKEGFSLKLKVSHELKSLGIAVPEKSKIEALFHAFR